MSFHAFKHIEVYDASALKCDKSFLKSYTNRTGILRFWLWPYRGILYFCALMEKTVLLDKPASLLTRIQDYAQLTKMRLASLVVFSAAMAYMTVPGQVNWIGLFWLTVGGFLVTGSANGFNQIIERDLDRKMDRTRLRPLPDLRISLAEAWLVCIVSGVIGIFILTYFMNVRSGLLGALAIVLYALVYTPMKKQSPFAVFVGAVPGAIPPLLGYVAATDGFTLQAWVLFSIQFIWQFPHFWAIAWVLHDDYKKAGFNLLPSGEEATARHCWVIAREIQLMPLSVEV